MSYRKKDKLLSKEKGEKQAGGQTGTQCYESVHFSCVYRKVALLFLKNLPINTTQ